MTFDRRLQPVRDTEGSLRCYRILPEALSLPRPVFRRCVIFVNLETAAPLQAAVPRGDWLQRVSPHLAGADCYVIPSPDDPSAYTSLYEYGQQYVEPAARLKGRLIKILAGNVPLNVYEVGFSRGGADGALQVTRYADELPETVRVTVLAVSAPWAAHGTPQNPTDGLSELLRHIGALLPFATWAGQTRLPVDLALRLAKIFYEAQIVRRHRIDDLGYLEALREARRLLPPRVLGPKNAAEFALLQARDAQQILAVECKQFVELLARNEHVRYLGVYYDTDRTAPVARSLRRVQRAIDEIGGVQGADRFRQVVRRSVLQEGHTPWANADRPDLEDTLRLWLDQRDIDSMDLSLVPEVHTSGIERLQRVVLDAPLEVALNSFARGVSYVARALPQMLPPPDAGRPLEPLPPPGSTPPSNPMRSEAGEEVTDVSNRKKKSSG